MACRVTPGLAPGPCSASPLQRQESPSCFSSLVWQHGPDYSKRTAGLPVRTERGDSGSLELRSRGLSQPGKLTISVQRLASRYHNGTTGVVRLCSLLASATPDVLAKGDGVPWYENEQIFKSCEVGTKLRVAVLLSGGVDSSVALRLLVAAGHECTAFYLKIWFQEDFENYWSSCPWEEDLKYAQDVCDEVGVDLRVVHLTDEYWSEVVAYSISEIKAGRTPNPDILCNTRIKFGSFFNHIDFDRFDRVASGHYATVDRIDGASQDTHTVLRLSADEIKDQTYFLSHLSQAQLSKLSFPLGGFSKPQVRTLADAMKLPNKARKDSQGICFLGKVRFSEFIGKHLGQSEGKLIEAETGVLLGKHNGFWFYTIGQRHGLRLPDGPWFVVAKDIERNAVFVSKYYFAQDKQRSSFRVSSLNWLSGHPPKNFDNLRCKVRHGPKFYSCIVECERSQTGVSSLLEHEGAQTAMVRLAEDDQGLAPGQFAVFYSGDVCIGSGVITEDPDAQKFCNVSKEALEAAKTGIHPERKKNERGTDSPGHTIKKGIEVSSPVREVENAKSHELWERIKKSVSLLFGWFPR